MAATEPRRSQHGSALWLLLMLTLLAGGYAFYRQAGAQPERLRRDAALLATMARAREALIARAVTDDNRPGSLPCPDLVTDSAGLSNHPGDGKADMFTLTQCPSYVGWLPWVTLDLPEPLDDSASRLWYALAPGLRDDDSAQPINSDSATTLQLDGQGDIAALIIAPRAALAGQNRPSRRPADYLDGGNGNDLRYISGPAGADFNDLVLPLSRRELFAAVDQRVAREVQACLERYAAAPGNPGRRYPWPAALGDGEFRGQAASRFGRVPLTQPGAGLQAALQTASDALRGTLEALDRAPDAAGRSTALAALGESLAGTRNFADALFALNSKLKQSADSGLAQLRGLDATLADAVANDRISRSEGSSIREHDAAVASPLGQLAEQLGQTGIDAFPARLKQLIATLDGAADAGSRQAAVIASGLLLAAATSPRTDIAAALANARGAAGSGTTGELRNALDALERTVSASRANLLASDFEWQASALAEQLAAWQASPDEATLLGLQQGLRLAAQSVDRLICGAAPVIRARNEAATAIATALMASPPEVTAAPAIAALRMLVEALAANEAADGNLSRTSLNAAIARFNAAAGRFQQVDLANPRPVQKDIVPYAAAVGTAVVDLATLAEMLAGHAAALAPLAKAAAGSDPARSGVAENSLWAAADRALASLNGKTGSLALQQTLPANPSSAERERAAAALAETRRLGQSALAAAQTLAQPLSGNTASALPMVWLAQACDFLQAGRPSWWQANRWADGVFYQFSSPSAADPGRLTVNGRPGYRLVTLSAGRALAAQRRNQALPAIGDFLEGANADPSRNPPAAVPGGKFASAPAGSQFNDQLAY